MGTHTKKREYLCNGKAACNILDMCYLNGGSCKRNSDYFYCIYRKKDRLKPENAPTVRERKYSIEEYKKYKQKILRQLGIRLTPAEQQTLYEKNTISSIDSYCRTLIFK